MLRPNLLANITRGHHSLNTATIEPRGLKLVNDKTSRKEHHASFRLQQIRRLQQS